MIAATIDVLIKNPTGMTMTRMTTMMMPATMMQCVAERLAIDYQPTWAEASTSMRAPRGSAATATAERAGRWSPKSSM